MNDLMAVIRKTPPTKKGSLKVKKTPPQETESNKLSLQDQPKKLSFLLSPNNTQRKKPSSVLVSEPKDQAVEPEQSSTANQGSFNSIFMSLTDIFSPAKPKKGQLKEDFGALTAIETA